MVRDKSLAIGIAFLVALAAFFWAVRSVGALIAEADAAVKVAVITAFVSIFVFVLGRWSERHKESKQKTTQEKIRVYKKFVDQYFSMMSHEKIHGHPKDNHELMIELLDFEKELIFWGSDNVISAYVQYKNGVAAFSSSSDELGVSVEMRVANMMRAVANVIAAMRRDIGYSFTSFDAKKLGYFQLASDPETRKIFKHL